MMFGPLTLTSQRISGSGTSFTVTPFSGTPTTPERSVGSICISAAGAVSVSPQDEVISGISPLTSNAMRSSPSQTSCGREAPA